MFTRNIRFSAICLVFLMTISLFAGCKDDVVADASLAPAVSETSSLTPNEKLEEFESDFLGSHDLGGINITIASTSKDFLFPDETETTIDQHKAEIIKDIAKRFNVTLEHVDIEAGEIREVVLPQLLTGDKVAHMILPLIWGAGILVEAGVCMDYKTPELAKHINFANPWWDQTMEYASTIGGATYCATPHFTSAVDYTFVMYFNKAIAADVGITDIYDLQENKEWTWDKFREYAKKAVKDLNGDGQMTIEDDRWGFLAVPYDSMASFLTGAAVHKIEVDKDTGKASFALGSPRNISVMTTLNEIYTTDGIYQLTSPENASTNDYFINGKSLFTSSRLSLLKGELLREMKDDYGVVLMPLGPDQKDYMSLVDHNASTVIIPSTNLDAKELEATAIVLEGLAFATWKQGVPDIKEFYSIQYTRDEESAWAINNVFDCTTYETSQFMWMMGTHLWAHLLEVNVLQNQICNTPHADISGEISKVSDIAQAFIDTLWGDKGL